MEKIKKAVSDTGPLLHLSEIGQFELLKQISQIFLTPEIFEECFQKLKEEIHKQGYISILRLNSEAKDFTKYLMEIYEIDLGEASGLALGKQEGVKIFLSDDLDARDVALTLGFTPHGSLGIVLRALRAEILSKKEAKKIVEDLEKRSSLFLSTDLIVFILKEIEAYSLE